jgi:hypothetical protein
VCLILKKKQILGYNQAQLNFLGFAKDLGAYFGPVAGLTINKINHLGILGLGLHPKFCGLWCVLAGYQWQNYNTTILAIEQERKKLFKNCSHICLLIN